MVCVTPRTSGVNSVAHRVRALPTESPRGGFDSDRINVFFLLYDFTSSWFACARDVWLCKAWLAQSIWDLTHLDLWKIYHFLRNWHESGVSVPPQHSKFCSWTGRSRRMVYAPIVSLHKNRFIRNPILRVGKVITGYFARFIIYFHKSKWVKSHINCANHATHNRTSLAHAYQLDVKSHNKKTTFIRSLSNPPRGDSVGNTINPKSPGCNICN